MKVQFSALIRRLEVKIDDSGDKSGKLMIEFRDEKRTFEKLNKVFKANHEVRVTIEDETQG